MKIYFIAILSACFSMLSFSAFRSHPEYGYGRGRQTSFLSMFITWGPAKLPIRPWQQHMPRIWQLSIKYGVEFIKYWVDEDKGLVYCLSSASDTASIRKTHAEAHGLLPDEYYTVTDGQAAALKGNNDLYLDIHELGPGNVTAKDVAAAHQKDLAVEGKYGVNFINYWVDEKNGVVMCLSQAKDPAAIVQTHKEAHGLLPVSVSKVEQGQ